MPSTAGELCCSNQVDSSGPVTLKGLFWVYRLRSDANHEGGWCWWIKISGCLHTRIFRHKQHQWLARDICINPKGWIYVFVFIIQVKIVLNGTAFLLAKPLLNYFSAFLLIPNHLDPSFVMNRNFMTNENFDNCSWKLSSWINNSVHDKAFLI